MTTPFFARSLENGLSDFSDMEPFVNTRDMEYLEEVIAEQQPAVLLADINIGQLTEEDGLEQWDLLLIGLINIEAEPEELLRILPKIDSGSLCFLQDDMLIENLTKKKGAAPASTQAAASLV